MKSTVNFRGTDEDDGIVVDAPIEDEPSLVADLILPIDDGTEPLDRAMQYNIPPAISPTII